MDRDIEKILLTEEQIRNRIEELGEILTREYEGKNPVIVGVLKGVVVFYADMIRRIKTPCQLDFMWISSYSGTQSSGMLVRQDVTADIRGRHVLILEDIFDTSSVMAPKSMPTYFLTASTMVIRGQPGVRSTC